MNASDPAMEYHGMRPLHRAICRRMMSGSERLTEKAEKLAGKTELTEITENPSEKRSALEEGNRPRKVPPRGTNKLRDAQGFKLRQQEVDKKTHGDADGTIHEKETQGAAYVIDGPLRRVTPYNFTYLTYCKLRWRDRKLTDVFVDEFRERDPQAYVRAVELGKVRLNNVPTTADLVVRNGDLISHTFHRHEPPVTLRPIKIVFEDDNILAIDKPSGIPVHPAGRYRYNSVTKVMQHERGQVVHPCNRLDRLTSGLMFLGKNARGADYFVRQIRERSVLKEYLARVKGRFPQGLITVDEPLMTASPKHALNVVDHSSGKEAATDFRLLAYHEESDTSLVTCFPKTGRTHQIRVHLQHMGHPIANDPIYLLPFVWGPELGRGASGTHQDVISRLDKIGKSRACSTWIHPAEDGEVLLSRSCTECNAPLYSDPGPNDLDLWLHAYKYQAADNSWRFMTDYPQWAMLPLRKYMAMALDEARKCGPTDSQFNVGAVLLHDGKVLSTGHSRELPGNTHAEQCALEKYFAQNNVSDVPKGTVIFTTMEPCSLRLSGNTPCVDRILASSIKTCFVGIVEPDTFVQNNSAKKKLHDAGIEYVHVPGFEDDCLSVATYGHPDK